MTQASPEYLPLVMDGGTFIDSAPFLYPCNFYPPPDPPLDVTFAKFPLIDRSKAVTFVVRA